MSPRIPVFQISCCKLKIQTGQEALTRGDVLLAQWALGTIEVPELKAIGSFRVSSLRDRHPCFGNHSFLG